HKTRHGSDIRDKRDETGDEADEQTEVESGESECDRVKGAEDEAHCGLPTHEAGDRSIHFAGEPAHSVAMLDRNPVVDVADHAVPVVDQVKGNYGRHDDKRE